MKGAWLIYRYFLSWQLMLRWFSAIGLFFLLVAPLIYLVYFLADGALIFNIPIFSPFNVTLYAYLCLIAFPFLSTPLAFRNLIANPQLSLIPNFRIKVGLSLFLITILLSLFPLISLMPTMSLPANFSQNIFIGVNIFCVASFYTLLFQLTLPSRYFIYIVSYGLILFIIFLGFLGETLINLLKEPYFVTSLASLSIVGWIIALYTLAKKKTFKPADQSIFNQDFLTNPESTWLNKLNFGKPKSSAGTLLTGLPDGLGERIARAFMVCILSPLIVTIFLMMIGFGRGSEIETLPSFPEFFLIFSFFTVSIGTYSNSNLAARSRYLWLRCGGNRHWQWRHMEATMLSNLFIQFCFLLLSCLVILIFTDFSAILVAQFILSLIVVSSLIIYIGLASRINNWPDPLLFIFMVGAIVGIIIFYFRLIMEDEYQLKMLIDIFVILIAFFLRYLAKQGFLHIDWLVIKPEVLKRNTMY